MPSINELRTLIEDCRYTAPNGACYVKDNCMSTSSRCYDNNCTGCSSSSAGYSKFDGDLSYYWSSTTVLDDDNSSINAAWLVYMSDASIDYKYFSKGGLARCVRNAN